MLKVGLCGVGGISGVHIPAWEAMEDAELVALCDVRPGQMEKGRLSSKCNTEEHLKRRAPTQSFAGPVIQVVESRGEVSGRNRVEITALREEKAKKAIGILIAAALPGLVRFGKEDGRIQLFLELMKLRKFRAIVQRKAMNRQAGQSRNNRLTRFSGRSCGYRCPLNVA